MLYGPNVISDKNQLLHDILVSSEEKQSYKLTENYLPFLCFKWENCYYSGNISWQLQGSI